MRIVSMAAVWAAVLFCGVAWGDEILLKNGEHVKGKVTQLLDGKMTVTSETLGDVKVPLGDILTFGTDGPILLHFKDKSVFDQKVTSSKEGWIAVPVGPDGKLQEFRVEDIDKINPPKTTWKGSVNISATATRGNTYTQGAAASMIAVRRSEIDRITFDAGYSSQRNKDPDTGELETTLRQSFAGLQYDYFFSEKIYGYANSRAERDAIAKIDVRLQAGAGGGWQIHESEDFNLAAEAGVSWISENYLSPDPGQLPTDDEKYFSGRVAYKTDGKFNDKVSFFHNATWYPAFEAGGGDLVAADGGIRSSLTDSMFAELKALWTWDSTPANAKKRTDVTYLFSLGWTF